MSVNECIQELIRLSDEFDDDEVAHLHRQTAVCLELFSKLPRSSTSLLVSGNETSSVAGPLAKLISTRVDPTDLLPLTNDSEANELAMNEDAVTLTPASFAAARLYARLLQQPGARVEMQAISSLQSMMHRWRWEVNGTLKSKPQIKANDKRKASSNVEIEEMQPFKRSKEGRATQKCADSDDDSLSIASGSDQMASHGVMAPKELLAQGLLVAIEVVQLPGRPDFMSWSYEAREVILETVSDTLATVSALNCGRCKLDDVKSVSRILEDGTQTLSTCIVNSRFVSNDGENLSKRHETTISLLRGLFPVLTMKVNLPKGEHGATAAFATAADVLESFIRTVAEDISTNPSHWPRTMRNATTKSARKSFSHNLATPMPRRRSERLSAGTAAQRQHDPMSTPKMKTNQFTDKTPANGTPSGASLRPVLGPLLGMLQKLATSQEADKSLVRNLIVDLLHRCTVHLPAMERSCFLEFIVQLCHSLVPVHRLIALELTSRLLLEEWLWFDHVHSQNPLTTPHRKPRSPVCEKHGFNMPAALFESLRGRLLDKKPAIRTATAAALSGLFSRIVESKDEDAASLATMGLVELLVTNADAIADELRKRAATDDRAGVRRASITALGQLFIVTVSFQNLSSLLVDADFNLFRQLSEDEATLTRKASVESLTRLLLVCTEAGQAGVSQLLEIWIEAVFPMVMDMASTCSNRAMELVNQVLLSPIIHGAKEKKLVDVAWKILGSDRVGNPRMKEEAISTAIAKLAESSEGMFAELLQVVCQVATEMVEANDVLDTLSMSKRVGAWCLLDSCINDKKGSLTVNRIVRRSRLNMSFIGSSWKRMLEQTRLSEMPAQALSSMRYCVRKSLSVLVKVSSCVDKADALETADSLNRLLLVFAFPPELIGAAVTALMALTVSMLKDRNLTDIHRTCAEKIDQLFQSCENEIAAAISCGTIDDKTGTIVRAFFTVGEASLVGFSATDDDARQASDAPNDPKTLLRGFFAKPSSKLVDLVQAFLSDSLPGRSDVATPDVIRAHAFTTFGKLCLRNELLAKKSLNLFARELRQMHDKESIAVQSNALVVLGDLCVKYTNMVDRQLPLMASCMQAGFPDLSRAILMTSSSRGLAQVRKHSVVILSSLLLQDYIKWRGLLFHRFLVATVDEDEEVGSLAELILCGPLKTKYPKLFSSNFVESIFVLNRCVAHPIYSAAASAGDGGSGVAVGFEGINLSGKPGQILRSKIYEMMLLQMSDEEKIAVTARITKEVLGSALTNGSDLNRACVSAFEPDNEELECAYAVVRDAFAILSNPIIRVGNAGSRQDEESEEPNGSRNVVAAKGRLLSTISRKHLIETILPSLCNLKSVLQQSCSPLLKHLMMYFVDVFRLYKVEVHEFLANDPDLLQEIKYDAKPYHKSLTP